MKKVVTLLLSAMLFVNACGISALAAENSAVITATPHSGTNTTLSLAVNAEGAESYEYQWYHSDSETGAYTPIYKQTGETYAIANDDNHTYIRAEVTPVLNSGVKGEPIVSDSYYVASISQPARTGYTTDREATKENPTANFVKVAGESILILDEYDDANSSFYVMIANHKGRRQFDPDNNTSKFNIEDTNNIAYFLNHEFLTDGNQDGDGKTYSLSQNMQKYIADHLWWTEGADNKSDCKEDYSFTAKIGLLSRLEYSKYWGKFGWDPYGDAYTQGWWLRTSRAKVATTYNAYISRGAVEGYGNQGSTAWGNTWERAVNMTGFYIKPTFYLGEDIFKNEKAEVSSMGAEVKKIFTERFTADELSGLYTTEELKKIGFELNEATITSDKTTPVALTTLTADYEDKNAVSYLYQWTHSDTEDGEYTDIYKYTDKTYLISNEDKGTYISVKITPVYADGTFGNTVTSSNTIYVENLGKVNRSGYSAEEREAKRNNPTENFFYAAGERLLLLDETKDENSTFYVMTAAAKGRQKFDPDNTQKFDIEDPNNIAYLLNNDFLDADKGLIDGNTANTLSQVIIPYIDHNHVWWTEPSGKNGLTADYSYTGPISLLSRSEYSKYWGKFGWDPEESAIAIKSGWWLRTARDTNATNAYVALGVSNGYPNAGSTAWGNTWDKDANSTGYYVRPTFWLNSRFFLENKVEVSTMGEGIKKMLTERYTKDDLKGLYTDTELGKIGFATMVSIPDEEYDIYTRSEAVFDVDYTASDMGDITITYSNGTQREDMTYFLYPDESYKETIAMTKLPYGKNNVTVMLKDGNGTVISETRKTICIIPDQPKEKILNNGVVIHPSQISINSDLLPLAAKLGFTQARIDFSWAAIEKTAGEYDFTLFDSIMAEADKNGIEILPILDYNNTLYSDDGAVKGGINTEAERTAFVNYAKAVANRYPQIDTFEIWNEPNSAGFWQSEANAADYSALVAAVSDALYEINPNYTLYAGAIDVSKSPESFVKAMFNNGLYDKFDALSYHPYFHPYEVNQQSYFENSRINVFKNLILDNGGFKDLAATEIGFDANKIETDGEEVKARETVKAIVTSNAYNLDSNYVFNLKNEGEEFGIFTTDLEPNSLMYSIAQMNSALGDAKFLGRLDTADTTYAYVYVKGNEPVVVCWSTNGDAMGLTGGASVYDLNGNAAEVVNNSITLSKSPVYIYGLDSSYLLRAAENETAVRKARITSRYPSVTESVLNSENAKEAILSDSALSDADKSAVLYMMYEMNKVNAIYNAVSDSSDLTVPSERYDAVSTGDSIYSRAALKTAKKYLDENNMLKNSAMSAKNNLIAANNAVLADLLESAELLGEGKEGISISDISVTDGTLTFKVNGVDSADVWVAEYNGNKLISVQKADINNPSCSVGTNGGKIFVWNGMTPLAYGEF